MFKKFKVYTLILWIIGWAIAYFILLPPINPSNLGFWVFFLPALFGPVFIVIQTKTISKGFNKGKALYPTVVVLVLVAIYLLGAVIFSPMFSSKIYKNRIQVTNGSFEDDIKEVDFNNLPLLDKDSARKVGDRVVGQIPELVSQFSVSDEYSLINYKDKIVRATPLEHNGLFKYFANMQGTAGYILVDCTTGEATLVKTEDGLKYLPSAYFFHDLNRHLRFSYPFTNFGDISFEVDEQGIPFWIVQTVEYTWVNLKKEVSGVIAVNAITGETHRYEVKDIPLWIDEVFDARLVIEEIDSWGRYQNGYLNSIFAQKNVVQTTDGYTYITMDDDVFMYTGITSISSDESNIGFVLVNLRTHEARFYDVPGAEEYSAMDSATGQVQEKQYTTTFPLLINLNGRPTYLLSLKDAAGLVKMYAFVDVINYQKVTVTDASLGIKYAAEQYLKMMGISSEEPHDVTSAIITIKHLTSVVVDGNTYYYIVSDNDDVYSIKASVNLSVTPFMEIDDIYRIEYYNDGQGNVIVTIEKSIE
ncbi:MAG: CvpA family protein [Erysipelotrichaceae bacterium]